LITCPIWVDDILLVASMLYLSENDCKTSSISTTVYLPAREPISPSLVEAHQVQGIPAPTKYTSEDKTSDITMLGISKSGYR